MKSRQGMDGSKPHTGVPVSRLRYAVFVSGGFASLVGLTAILGWFTRSPTLQSFFAGSITIKTNTAICLLLAGLSLLLQASRPEPLRTYIGRVFAVIVGIIGAATLSEHLFGWDLGIDQVLFRESPGALATSSPNRM